MDRIGRRKFLGGLALTLGTVGVATPAVIIRGAAAQAAKSLIKGVYSAPGLSFAGINIAEHMGLWDKHNLAAEVKRVRGGPLAMAALTNSEAQFAGVASTDPIIGWGKGIKTLTVSAFTGALDMQFTASNGWLAKVGLTPKSKLEDKLKALKGARIGASTIGGGPAQYTRYLATTVGLDPEQDLKILAVGFGAPRMAALRTNQVDVTVGSAPEADQVEIEGFGKLFIDCANDVELFKEFPYTVCVVTPKFAEEQSSLVRRIAQTFGEANDMIHNKFGATIDLLKKQFPKIPPLAIERAMERARNGYPRGGKMTAKMWENNIKVAVTLKMIPAALPAKEGELWTNKFLG
jgi:NitT/TauT family transport system substrate-binding protein